MIFIYCKPHHTLKIPWKSRQFRMRLQKSLMRPKIHYDQKKSLLVQVRKTAARWTPYFQSEENLVENFPWTKGKTHIKKVYFLVVGQLRFYPPYTNGLVVHAKKPFIMCVFPNLNQVKAMQARLRRMFGNPPRLIKPTDSAM